ncbi:MAG: hypothetical protein V1735_02185 [Nanoarchaeota archaeon]
MAEYRLSRRTALRLMLVGTVSAPALLSGCKPGDPLFHYVIPLPDRAEAYLVEAKDNADIRYRGMPVREELMPPLEALIPDYQGARPVWDQSDALRKSGSLVPEGQLWYHQRCVLLPKVQAVQDSILSILENRPQDLNAENYPAPRVKFDVVAWLQKAQDAMNLMSHKELIDQTEIAFSSGDSVAGAVALERLHGVVDILVRQGYSLQHRANLLMLEKRYRSADSLNTGTGR